MEGCISGLGANRRLWRRSPESAAIRGARPAVTPGISALTPQKGYAILCAEERRHEGGSGMILPERAEEVLRPFLGTAFLRRNADLPGQAAAVLTSFRPARQTLRQAADQVDNLLFMRVREDTGGRMALTMDNGALIRLRMSDFSVMADELLYLLLENLPKTGQNQALIREYSMRSGSLSALRALYLLYRDMQEPEETETLRRVITSCHEPWRFRSWMDAGE